MTQPGLSFGMPAPREGSLWNPALEQDSCGIGFVADVHGRKSHQIVTRGIEAVCRLTHRGAVANDGKTGDGAGILTQIPHELFLSGLGKGQRKMLRRPQDLAVGMIFLPTDDDARRKCYRLCEAAVAESGLAFVEWRHVPVEREALGERALESCPKVRQLMLARVDEMDDATFDRVCYLLRKDMESRVAKEGINGFYIPSLSHQTIVYKGLVVAPQLPKFYVDLQDERYVSSLALYHQRYSTNTFPTWFLAQPFRFLAHNGEINTLQGNVNWMRARELSETSSVWNSKEALANLRPIVQPGGSDSAGFDNCLESIVLGGRDLLHAVLMMVPEAYATNDALSDDLRAFYDYHACIQEPWDGPAAVSFTDGRVIGATLDRNGLRPQRYQISDDGLLIIGSEVGVVDLHGAKVLEKGRLGPGEILALDTETGELMRNDDIKARYAARQPYRAWVSENLVDGEKVCCPTAATPPESSVENSDLAFVNGVPLEQIALLQQQKAFGVSEEDVDDMVRPMLKTGSEAIYSMGDDTPLAVLSDKPRTLYTYFRQRFAQVTNPPIDPLREKLVMSLSTKLGRDHNLWDERPEDARKITFASPLLTHAQMTWLRNVESELNEPEFKAATVSAVWPISDGEGGLEMAVRKLREDAASAVRGGASILIVSDKGVDADHAPIPALLAVGAVHHHLIREGLRTRASIVSETGEARDSHQFACLLSFGASAVYPYLTYETVADLCRRQDEPVAVADGINKVRHAAESGLLKIMSKMGISTLASYGGAQIFEALGLAPEFVAENFTHTPSRIKGASYPEVARDVLEFHAGAYPPEMGNKFGLENYNFLRYRKGGEEHAFNPQWFKKVHDSVRKADGESFRAFAQMVNQRENPIALRDLLEYVPAPTPISVDDVEAAENIFPRLATGAMSHGALSSEAHECLAIAMNRLGGRSNSGEGGEDARRFRRDENGDWRNSAIKQIASGRFGVTPEYLASSKELQIKMAQGAKPGEGGQLPGFKVNEEIASVRHSVPGVTLISPPPHHDIYSIEDLAQLIYDLKMVNPRARVSVKLVAQAGVGTVAAGVAKAYADTIVISGHDGGTGASPVVSIKNTGVSWELGLAEAQQVLIQNGLRGRVRLHADGGFKTGRDVIMAALLGAEEYGFGTAALVAAGCVMARQCHLNTCPVGVATQNNELRAKFPGDPEHVVNFFKFVVQEIREHLALMGVRRLEDIIGRSDLLRVKADAKYPKAHVDLSPLFFQFEKTENNPHRCVVGKNDRPADWPLDETILQDARDAISDGKSLTLSYPIENINRSVGARLSGQIAYLHGDKGLTDNTLTLQFHGSAGQSFGAFNIHGMKLQLIGEACDYVGKGMHGGSISVRPSGHDPYAWHENTIIGNTVLYGATGGELFAAGMAGERFAVRNSGATAVVEGVGDHGCEYMTGGVVVVLGRAGRNFGAGMSGGVAYIYDEADTLPKTYNPDMVGLERVESDEDKVRLRSIIERYAEETTSPRAHELLSDFDATLTKFYKVVPRPEKAPAPKAESEKKERRARGIERAENPARVASNGNGETRVTEQVTVEQQATLAEMLPATGESPQVGSTT